MIRELYIVKPFDWDREDVKKKMMLYVSLIFVVNSKANCLLSIDMHRNL